MTAAAATAYTTAVSATAAAIRVAATAAASIAAAAAAAAVVHSLIWFQLKRCFTAYLQHMFKKLQYQTLQKSQLQLCQFQWHVTFCALAVCEYKCGVCATATAARARVQLPISRLRVFRAIG
eukprot:21112-Heterococcus_DN1.PRE.4